MAANWIKTVALKGKTADADYRQGTAQEVHPYQVFFDAPDANAYQAILAQDIPAPNELLDATALRVANVKAKQNADDPSIFDVDVTYTPISPNQVQLKPPGATKWNVEISGNSISWQEEVHQDKNQAPIVNTNKEPINPPLQKTGRDERIQVSYFCTVPEWAIIDGCRGKSNDAAITLNINGQSRTFAVNTLKLDETAWGRVLDANGAFAVQISLIFLYRKDDWSEKIPNLSYYSKNSAGKLVPFVDANGQPNTVPTYLDEHGKPLADGASVYFLSFDIVETTSFSSLLSELT